MLYGIGTDILNIHQIESSVSDRQDPFVRKIYTPAEIELIESRPIPLYSYATRFHPENEIGTRDSPSYYPITAIYSFGFNFKF